MATTHREAYEALLEAIKQGAQEIVSNEFEVSRQAGTLETLARAFALVKGKSEP